MRATMPASNEFVLTLSCPDSKGIVYAVSGLLYQAGCNIVDSQQFGDVQSEGGTGLFFMRVHFEAAPHLAGPGTLDQLFTHVREIRPQAWPNSRMIALADDLLGRDGALKAALRRHYGEQIRRKPDLAEMIKRVGRGREVLMAA